jgi:hypothetical protein
MNTLLKRLQRTALLTAALILTTPVLYTLPHAAAEAVGMSPGSAIGSGDKLQSPDGHYVLIMQNDGNLVDYSWPRPLWASNTGNHPGSSLAMQGDGNLVIYAPGGIPIWASNTAGHPGAYFEVQNDANMIIRAANGAVLWASSAVDTRIDGGQRLNPGWQFQSPDRNYTMIMQGDGNLVLYNRTNAIWTTGTNRPGSEVEMQGDGNLVIYAPGHVAVWSTSTFKSNSALVAQNDRNFVIYAPGNIAVWSTGTSTGTLATTTPVTSLTACPTMSQGASGSCVALLQQYLNRSAAISPALATDGAFGSLTRQAVINFQSRKGLAVDGIAGPATKAALVSDKPATTPAPAPAPAPQYVAPFNPVAAARWAQLNSGTSVSDQQAAPCTMFASRALYDGGGMPQRQDWHPTDPVSQYVWGPGWPSAWYAARNFKDLWVRLGYAEVYRVYPGTVATASLGDIVYYQWDANNPNETHISMVTSFASNGSPKVTEQNDKYTHTNDRLWDYSTYGRPAPVLMSQAYPNIVIYVIHWKTK